MADRQSDAILVNALGWISGEPIEGEDGSGFVLMGPGVYYFLGGTMSGKSTTIREFLLERNELIAFQHADDEIR